jgi:hypothetical protein
MEQLTELGREYARANADNSVVANVALHGLAKGWPQSHVDAAIAAVNKKAIEEFAKSQIPGLAGQVGVTTGWFD